MLTCKDCIHCDVCDYHITDGEVATVEECLRGFKHKDQYIKLPAYIGQEVWLVFYGYAQKSKIREGKISMIQQKADKSWKLRVSCNGSVCDYTVEDIGEFIFTSYEEALLELNKQSALENI